MKCPKCFTENTQDSRFCKTCATPLPAVESEISLTKTLETTTDALARGIIFAGRYEVIEELGAGGMGRVYRVYDKKIEEEVALKLIRPDIAAEKRTVERFRNEIKTARKISHKNVCRTHDLGEEGMALFITMEYVRGEDLKSVIRRMKVLAPGTAVSIARQVAEGLGEAHRLGVVHRDLKPSNIMIDKDGNAKIMDFGIARSLARPGTTAEGAIIGTPEYMSPEQVEGKPADQRADIYALGVILFEMVTGRPPFEGETSLAVAHKHRYEPAPDPQTLNPQISPDLGRLILRCVEKEREKRYKAVGEFLSELEAVEALLPTAERAPTGRPATGHKPTPSKTITVKFTPRKLLIPAVALAVIAAIVIGLTKFLPKSPTASIDSIAVLPFRSLSADKEQEYWADAITVALTGKLGQVSGLKRVISSQSAMTFKGSNKRASEIGRELSVTGLVQGSIIRAENQVRISVQLVEAKTEKQLWSQEYDYETKDILALQNKATKAIIAEIGVKLTAAEDRRLSGAKQVNPSAFDAYLRLLYKSTAQQSLEEGLRNQEEGLKEIIRQDPGFALAYVELAQVYFSQAGMCVLPAKVGFEKCRETALKALEIDDSLGRAHVLLGMTKVFLEYDWMEAEEEIKLGLKFSANDTYALGYYGYFLAYLGRFEEAVRAAQRAVDIDPLDERIRRFLGWVYYHARRYDEAIEIFARVIKAYPNDVLSNEYLLTSYFCKNMRKEALAQAEKLMTLPDAEADHTILSFTGYVYGALGEKRKAKDHLEKMLLLAQKGFVDPQAVAFVYVGLGDINLALEYIERAYEQGTFLAQIKVEPALDPLRGEPRFQAILKKIGLAD